MTCKTCLSLDDVLVIIKQFQADNGKPFELTAEFIELQERHWSQVDAIMKQLYKIRNK